MRQRREAKSPYLLQSLRMRGFISPLPYTSAWSGTRLIKQEGYFTFITLLLVISIESSLHINKCQAVIK
jgi:hypothetical protein